MLRVVEATRVEAEAEGEDAEEGTATHSQLEQGATRPSKATQLE